MSSTNRKNPNTTSTKTPALRAALLYAAGSLLLVPCLSAQTPAPAAKGAPVSASPEPGRGANPAAESEARLYTIKFDGGSMLELSYVLREKFPEDNFVIDDSDRRLRMPGFELRNVRLAEIGRTVEFLTKGQYKVEIVDGAPGNIWRIGPVNKSAQAVSVKMRSVAAPNLFSTEKALTDIQEAAERMELERLNMIGMDGGNLRGAMMRPLTSQKIFVIMGDEEGVAGLESLIKAAEQRLSEAAAAMAAAFAADGPKIRAVLAPHVFAEEQRWKKLTASLQEMQAGLNALRSDIQKASGSDIVQVPWAEADPRAEQKVFVLRGTEAGISGMESLIKAAEQLAGQEDAILSERFKAEAQKAEEKAALKAEEPRAKAGSREQ